MDTALIIVIAVAAALLLFLIARRVWARGIEARREKAGELRVESTRRQEEARRAEREAERQREAADATTRRAERIDPDVETPGRRRFGVFRRDGGEDHDETAGPETAEADDRPSLWDRLVHR